MSSKESPVLIPEPREIIYRSGRFTLSGKPAVHLGGVDRGPTGEVLLAELSEVLRGLAPAASPPAVLRCEARGGGGWLRVSAEEGPASAPRARGRLRPEGYELRVTPRAVEVAARDEAGLFYGVMTLRQLAAGRRDLPCVSIRDWPELSLRGVHYDLKGLMPTFDALMRSLDGLARFKLNCILLEYEDKFPWSEQTGLASPLALSQRQLRRFLEAARARHIRVIPLIQSLGHAEMVLQHRRYARLREVNDNYYQYCPSRAESAELVKRLIDEVLAYHPDEPLFHVGADEAWLLGTCPQCERAAAKVGKNGLYLQHMEPIWRHVLAQGKQPVMWDDMLRHFSEEELERVPREVALMYWLYNRFEPDVEKNFPHLPHYLERGFTVIGASAAKGADGRFANLPHFDRRLRNVFAWAQVARRHRLPGVVSTAWSRYTYLLAPCEPFDTIWLSLAGSAHAYWLGQAPSPAEFTQRFLRFTGADARGETAPACLQPDRREMSSLAERLSEWAAQGGPWAGYWSLLGALAELEAWLGRRDMVQSHLLHQLPALEAGRLPRSARRRLRREAAEVLAAGRSLRRRLRRQLRRGLPRAEVEEFLASRLDGHEALMRGLLDVVG